MRATSVQSVVGGERTATCHVNVDRDACQASNLAGKKDFYDVSASYYYVCNFSPLRMSRCVHPRTWSGCIGRIINGFHCAHQAFWQAFFQWDMNIGETK